MVTYIARRVLYSIPVLILSSFFSFLFVSYAANPLVAIRSNPRLTQTALNLAIHQNHLDKPVVVRYFYWVEAIFTDKLGRSLITLKPIWPDITRTMGHTAQLIIISESLAIILGIAVGIYSAIRQYSFFDYSFTSLSFLGFAMPTFWLALVLQILFVDIYNSWHVRIFYTSGLNTVPGGPSWSLDRLQHLALPVLTLLIISFAIYSRYMRASMLDVINSEYVRTARAKGVRERDGGLPGLKALGLALEDTGVAQVSMNITRPDDVALHEVYEEVRQRASLHGVEVSNSELIGSLRLEDLLAAVRHYLSLPDLRREQVLDLALEEHRES
jgi:peptide/nickel transport system permease protein